ncbi:TPA: gas vesicle accessory protein GvpU [Vibrio parahaemolyticus]|nr:hypothetical protein [Vibrio parahaemolyticus]
MSIEEKQENNVQPEPNLNVDWFLANIVANVNLSGESYGITLYCNGMIITGELISGKEYFESLSQRFASASCPAEEHFVVEREYYSNLIDDNSSITTFIHMKEAKVMHINGKSIPANGCLWRGQLSHVTGFHFGTLVAE